MDKLNRWLHEELEHELQVRYEEEIGALPQWLLDSQSGTWLTDALRSKDYKAYLQEIGELVLGMSEGTLKYILEHKKWKE